MVWKRTAMEVKKMKGALIQVRVDDVVKKEADTLFRDLGLDTQTAIRMFLRDAISRQGLPFDVQKRPAYNAETLAAMEDARLLRGLHGPFHTVGEMTASILAEDEGDDV